MSFDNSGSYCLFSQCGASYIQNYPIFPTQVSGFIWEFAPAANDPNSVTNILVASAFRELSAIMTVNFLQNISYYVNSNDICPYGQFIELNGCYACATASTIILSLKSTCMPGNCILSTQNSNYSLFTNSISLSNSFQTFPLTLISGISAVNFNLLITCKDQTLTLNVNGTLIPQNLVQSLSVSQISSNVYLGNLNLQGLSNLLNTNTFWTKFIFIVFWIVMFAIALCIFCCTFRYCNCCPKLLPVNSTSDTVKTFSGWTCFKKVMKKNADKQPLIA